MSFIRRVKSFSVKKPKDSNQDDAPPRLRPRKKTNLHRQKSFSMEYVPFRLDLERNDLFMRQKIKLEREERPAMRETPKRRVRILEKTDSLSLDESRFSQYVTPPSVEKNGFPSSVELRDSDNFRNKNPKRFNTVSVIKKNEKDSEKPYNNIQINSFKYHNREIFVKRPKPVTNLTKSKSDWYINLAGDDLITEFGEDSKSNVDEGGCNKPASFPVFDEDEEVQIRQSPRTLRPPERPKTFTSPTTKKNEEAFVFKGPFGLECGKEDCIKIRSNETFRATATQLQILDENQCVKNAFNRSLKKGTKIISKTEVEMLDTEKTAYRFVFQSPKDAKLFVEREKMRLTKDKTPSPFSIAVLLKLLKKRSSRDLLESKGIIRNEPIFGNTLRELCDESEPVPEVVTRIVELIEEPENIKSMGLYRASANLAVVQNIRFEINCGRWEILEKYRRDVDVLAGTLKLFFRELKEPVIPYENFQKLLATIQGSSSTGDSIGTIIDSLPGPNRATLLYIIRHLLKVCSYKDENKMDVHNMAICWGPSLIMFPENCVDLVAQTAEYTAITRHLLEYYDSSTSSEKITKIDDPPPKQADFAFQVVQKFTETIESNLNLEGIYRKSGSNTKIDKIMKQLEKKQLNDVDCSKCDIHDLCCALKKFLGSLKEPLIPNEIFNYYCEICDKLNEQLVREEIRERLKHSSHHHTDTLLLLLRHLRKVIAHEKHNRMTLHVITEIWTTTLAKKKMPKFSKLFEILVHLDEQILPDLLPASEALSRIRESQYDNVLDNISNNVDTKL